MLSLLFLSCGTVLICLSSLVQPIFAQGYSDSSVMTTTALSLNPTIGPMDGWGYYACVSDQGDLMASPLSVAFPGLLNRVQLSVAATYTPVFQGRA